MLAEVTQNAGQHELWAPVIQYGFAGTTMVLIGVIVWIVNKLISVLERTNTVIESNTLAIREVGDRIADLLLLTRGNRELLLSRPCIAEFMLTKPAEDHPK
jgi:hypothetical protein